MAGYLFYSVAVWLVVRRLAVLPAWSGPVAHGIDLAVVSLVTWFTAGPGNPVFVLYCFVFLMAGFRWGLAETVLNGAFAVAITTAEAVMGPGFTGSDADIVRLGSRGALLLLLSGMVGYLARAQKRAQATAREHARAAEREHVSHELHDGVIQTLLGTRLQLAALRHRTDLPADVTGTLDGLDATLRREVTTLRVAMFDLAPVATALSLRDSLADVASRFHHATGINTSIECDVQVAATPETTHGLSRILQEALVNVQRHTGATQVRVRLVEQDGLQLTVEDNGQGFPFDGRLSNDDTARLLQLGPRVLIERVRALGGRVTIWSTPSIGAQIQVVLPLSGRVGPAVAGLTWSTTA